MGERFKTMDVYLYIVAIDDFDYGHQLLVCSYSMKNHFLWPKNEWDKSEDIWDWESFEIYLTLMNGYYIS